MLTISRIPEHEHKQDETCLRSRNMFQQYPEHVLRAAMEIGRRRNKGIEDLQAFTVGSCHLLIYMTENIFLRVNTSKIEKH